MTTATIDPEGVRAIDAIEDELADVQDRLARIEARRTWLEAIGYGALLTACGFALGVLATLALPRLAASKGAPAVITRAI